jgi:hypothetical protein
MGIGVAEARDFFLPEFDQVVRIRWFGREQRFDNHGVLSVGFVLAKIPSAI